VLDRLSIRSKIAVILLLPVLGLGVLAWLRVDSSVATSRQAARVTRLTEFALRGTALVDALQTERGLSNRFLLRGVVGVDARSLATQRAASDRVLADYRASADSLDTTGLAAATISKLGAARNQLNGLAGLRGDIDNRSVSPSGALDFYGTTIADLVDTNSQIAAGITDRELAQRVGAFVSISRIKELIAPERDLVLGVLARGGFAPGDYQTFTSRLSTRDVVLAEFQSSATDAQRDRFVNTLVGPEVQRAKELQTSVLDSGGTGKLQDVDPAEWWSVTSTELGLLHQVEQGFGNDAVARSQAIESSARAGALRDSGAVAVVLALAIGLSLLVARSMLHPLRLLKATAVEVARERLPGVVEKLAHSTSQDGVDLSAELKPLRVRSRDEIGEVAEAFNAVHEVAVEVAVEQAALRLSIGDMFLNMARRSQNLIDRQLELMDELEQDADVETLENLFKLDHLATRMRRNAENLIVLSGAEPPRRWVEPIALTDVLRGAIAEVEDYQRVDMLPVEEVGVPGHAVADVIHLLAELIENATSFSPPGTTVQVAAQPVANGHVIEIEDRGLGMSDKELIEANQRLAHPPAIDSAVSRRLGLFVVGRLAQRYGIKVQLRHSYFGGITALVLLPRSLTITLEPQQAMSVTIPGPGTPSGHPELAAPAPQHRPQPQPQPQPQPALARGHGQAAGPAPPAGAFQPAGTGAGGEPGAGLDAEIGNGREDRLPIFEQARSDWFDGGNDLAQTYLPLRRHGHTTQPASRPQPEPVTQPLPQQPPPQAPPVSQPPAPPQHGPLPRSQGAPLPRRSQPQPASPPPAPAAAATPTPPAPAAPVATMTSGGLPRRVPRTHLAAGFTTQWATGGPPPPAAPASRSPEETRRLLTSYRAGLEQGRLEGRQVGGSANGDGEPKPNRQANGDPTTANGSDASAGNGGDDTLQG
jgi:signal transduction histidine kinase